MNKMSPEGLALATALAKRDPSLEDDMAKDSWPDHDGEDFQSSILLKLARLIEVGRVDLLRRALTAAPSLGMATWTTARSSGQTLLMEACFHGDAEAVDALLPLSNPWAAQESGEDSLHEACSGRVEPKVVEVLLAALGAEKNIDLSKAGWSPATKSTALMVVADSYGEEGNVAAVVKMLLPWHNVNEKSREGCTALSYAARAGHVMATQALLAHGADPLISNERGDTALMEAARMGRPEIVAMLLPVSRPLAVGAHGLDALALADPSCKAIIASWIERQELDALAPSGIVGACKPRL